MLTEILFSWGYVIGIFLITSPVHILFGRFILRQLQCYLFKQNKGDSDLTVEYLVGLLSTLWLTLYGYSAGCSITSVQQLCIDHADTALIPVLLGHLLVWVFRFRSLSEITLELRDIWRNRLSASTALFLLVISALGATIFDTHSGITTPWINNYADLAFHLGQVSSFARGANFPPEYVIFAGERLSYPMFINLWSAILWVGHPTWFTLKLIFVAQWIILWNIIFYAFPRRTLLPWALLFGGGTWAFLAVLWRSEKSVAAHELLGSGLPWTPFLTTLWIPQRSLLFGAAIVVVLLHRLLRCQWNGPQRPQEFIKISALLSLLIFAHTHAALVMTLLVGGIIFLTIISNPQVSSWKSLSAHLPFLFLPCIAWLAAFPFLLGKHGTVQLIWGWLPKPLQPSALEPIVNNSFSMWLVNWGVVFILSGVIAINSKHRGVLTAICALFIIGNVIQFSVWDWDQIKWFVILYVALLVLAGDIKGRGRYLVEALCVLLIVPSLIESIRALTTTPDYPVYTPKMITAANELHGYLPACAVVVTPPDHNSAVTLSGRRIFSGYAGTLNSHGIDYRIREDVQKSGAGAVQNYVTDKNPFNACGVFFYSPRGGKPNSPLLQRTPVTNLYELK